MYIFTGCCENTKGYRLTNGKCPTKMKIERDVVFKEGSTNDQVRISEEKIEEVMIGSENGEKKRSIESPNVNRRKGEAVQTEIQVSGDNEKESQDENVRIESKTGDLSSKRSERLPKPGKWSSDTYLYYIELTNSGEPKSVEEVLPITENNKWYEAMKR
ncbi:hypothetical protein JTB14_014748 [Gonioctena quinquepunctata]|nr:hypothetical protein JTB14_014748 [Gonioctena quinquepunctata]